jgi:hypothetical protein
MQPPLKNAVKVVKKPAKSAGQDAKKLARRIGGKFAPPRRRPADARVLAGSPFIAKSLTAACRPLRRNSARKKAPSSTSVTWACRSPPT